MIHPYVYAGLPKMVNKETKDIINVVCEHFKVSFDTIRVKSRKVEIVKVRMFIWLFLHHKKMSYRECSEIIGIGHDHSTVHDGIKKLKKYIEVMICYQNDYSELSERLQIYPLTQLELSKFNRNAKVVQIPTQIKIEPKKAKKIEIPKSRYDIPHAGWGKTV